MDFPQDASIYWHPVEICSEASVIHAKAAQVSDRSRRAGFGILHAWDNQSPSGIGVFDVDILYL